MTNSAVRFIRRHIRNLDEEADAFKIHILYEIIIIYQMVVQHHKAGSSANKKVPTNSRPKNKTT